MTYALRYGAPLVFLTLLGGCATTDSEAGKAQATFPATQPSRNNEAAGGAVGSTAAPKSQQLAAVTVPTRRSVYYDFDRTDVKPKGEQVIDANAQYLRDHSDIKVRIEGNTDERGSREYNLALGQRRAEGVAQRMELLGVPEQRIEAVSFGEEKPKKTGRDEASWAENRRSDIDY